MEYLCLHATSTQALTNKVNDAMEKGYVPIGGVSCSSVFDPNTRHLTTGQLGFRHLNVVQAMYRKNQ